MALVHDICNMACVWTLFTAVECDELYEPTDGEVVQTAKTPGSLATYTCAERFALKGHAFQVHVSRRW